MANDGASRPNVLIIMSDQHSKHVLGAYGNDIIRTPNLDRLAAGGMRFDNCYCPAPLCVPSRMSFMTGKTPSQNRVWGNRDSLDSNIPTWAHALGAVGYETTIVGRMHFVGPDQRHGFSNRAQRTYFGAPYFGTHPAGAPLFKDIPPITSGQDRAAVEVSGYGRTTYQAFDDLVTDSTAKYLEQQGSNGSDQPFAAVAGFVLPHCPFFAPKELFDYYYKRVDVPIPTEDELRGEPEAIRNFKQVARIEEPIDPDRIRIARAAYFGLVEYVDTQVGRILGTLERSGLAENTLVIYTSDHGEMGGEHGCWWKSTYYEGSVGVPLIASMPGTIPAGTSSDAVCNLYDIGPTVIDIAGGDALPDIEGRSLARTLTTSHDPDWENETFAELTHEGIPSRMIRRGPWKLYRYDDDTQPALFNLDTDPDEHTNLGEIAQYADVRTDLLERLAHGWNPQEIRRVMAERARAMPALCAWSAVVNPAHPDMIEVPDVEDVTIL
jgi:choline-sulfatase